MDNSTTVSSAITTEVIPATPSFAAKDRTKGQGGPTDNNSQTTMSTTDISLETTKTSKIDDDYVTRKVSSDSTSSKKTPGRSNSIYRVFQKSLMVFLFSIFSAII